MFKASMILSQRTIEVSDLYLSNKLEECIELSNQLSEKELEMESYYQIQIFKGLSHYQMSHFTLGLQCFLDLFKYSSRIKQGKVEGIDVIMKTVFQWQRYEEDNLNAVKFNNQLLEVCQKYQQQQQNTLKWNEGIYHFGMSIYHFILKFDEKFDNTHLLFLIQHLGQLKELKQIAQLTIGWMYLKMDLIDEAIIWFLALEKINPNFPTLFTQIGIIYTQKGDNDKAIEYYQKQISTCPQNAIGYAKIACHYKYIEKLEKAEEYYKKSLIVNTKNDNNFVEYADFLFEQQRYEESFIVLKGRLNNNPNSLIILASLMSQERRLMNQEKSLGYLNKILEINIEDGIFEYDYGYFLYHQNELSSSLEYFIKSLKKYLPHSYIVQSNSIIGRIFFLIQEYNKCLVQYFNTCNLLYNSDLIDIFNTISSLLSDPYFLSLEERIKIIDSQYGIVQTRFNNMIHLIQDKHIKNLMKRKQEYFLTILNFIAYFKNIQPFLAFQNDLSHWDLYID